MSSSAEATDNDEKVAATTSSDDSMDAILKDALDEFDDDDDDDDVEEAEIPSPRQKLQVETVSEDDENDGQGRGENETPPSTRISGPLPSPANNHSSSFSAAMMDEDALLQSMLQDFMQTESAASENDPAAQLGAFLKQVEAAEQLASTSSSSPTAEASHKSTATKPNTSIASTNNKAKPKASPNSSSGVDNNSNSKSAMEDTIHSLLQDMAKVNVDDDQEGEGGGPELSLPPHNTEDELFQQLFGNFGGTESSFEPDAMIDGMMEQLLSKELMYEPMKSVTDKFPEWLEEQKNLSKLSPEELKMRQEQYKCFQKLVETYENEPKNTSKLVDLMQQVQEYGQPPQEIINDIAPGLELDEDGMPKMNPFDMLGGAGGGMPPFGAGVGEEDCTIM